MILGDLLKSGAKQFQKADLYFGHGTDNAWDEAVWIALYVLQESLNASNELLKRVLKPQEVERIEVLYARRIKERIPVAYLIEEAWFGGLSFFVDPRVLIPRSPLAELIAKNFKPYLKIKKDAPLKILDLCTGSACIAILCALQFSNAKVDALDLSSDALEVAKINLEKYDLSSRLTLIQSDLLDAVKADQQYDLIISNPPYVDARDMRELPKEYRHEPRLALEAGSDGLVLIDRILEQAARYLSPAGILVVEVGNSHLALTKKYPKLPFRWVRFTEGEGEVFVLSRKAFS